MSQMTMGPNLVNLTIVAGGCVRSDSHQFEIRVAGLEDFTLLHNSSGYVRFPSVDFPALKHAVGLHNAEFVSLSYSIIQTLSMVPGILEDQPSPFRRLKSLTLELTSDLKHWQIPAKV
ncbi:hypothetical protein Tsubulata_039937, partial [Turnera subulata]